MRYIKLNIMLLNVNDRIRTTTIVILLMGVLALCCSTCLGQSLTLGSLVFSLETPLREAEQRRNENRISGEQIGSMPACFTNISQLSLGILRSQSILETQIVKVNERLANDHVNRSLPSSVMAVLNDVELTLLRKMSPTLEIGSSTNTLQYRMTEALTHTDVIAVYSLNLLRNISAKIDEISTVTLHGKRRNSTFDSENNFFENARRRAVAITPATRPPWLKAIEEMQAWSEFVSPALRRFEFTTTFSGCQDAFTKGATNSGVYVISRDRMDTFRAWCDFDSHGGWLVFQRRFDGTVDYFRRWSDYEKGFGNLWGEHWLGLEILHQLTHNAVPLSIYMQTFEATSAWANYSSFRIGDVSASYRLNIDGYSGTAGNSLLYHNGRLFCTWDRDNDNWSDNCARVYTGGWWFYDCLESNLNGRYERGQTVSHAASNLWGGFKGYGYGLKVTLMRILL